MQHIVLYYSTNTLFQEAQHQTEIAFGAKPIGKVQPQSKLGSIQRDSELVSLFAWWGVEGEDLFENIVRRNRSFI